MEILAIVGLSKQALILFAAAILFMFIDIVTGLAGAIKNNEVSSTKMREGLFHKGGMFVCIVVAWIMECVILYVPELGITVPLLIPACSIVILTELSSILENVCTLNPNLASSKLLSIFKQIDSE